MNSHNKIVIFHGPHGAGKSFKINELTKTYQTFSYTNYLLDMLKYKKKSVPATSLTDEMTRFLSTRSIKYKIERPKVIIFDNFESIKLSDKKLINKYLLKKCKTSIDSLYIIETSELAELSKTVVNKSTIKNIPYNEKTISYDQNLIKKPTVLDIYQKAKSLLSKDMDLSNLNEIYENDKSMLPLMIYENYSNYTINTYYVKIMESFCINDIIEEHVYSYQKWGLSVIQIFFSVINTLDVIRNNSKNCKKDLKYIKEIHKTSAKNSNRKLVKSFKDIFCDNNMLYTFNQENINNMNNIFNTLKKTKIIKHYDLDIKQINSMFNTSKQIKSNVSISDIKKKYYH